MSHHHQNAHHSRHHYNDGLGCADYHHHHREKHQRYREQYCCCDDSCSSEQNQGSFKEVCCTSIKWTRRFISPDEKKQALEGYIDSLKKELAGAEFELSKVLDK